jgi:DMSO/TMAO reductase YedYZ molybdopterin-dependent catalytic subunit
MSEVRDQPQRLTLAAGAHATEDRSLVGADVEQAEAGLDPGADGEVEREMRRLSRRGFLWGAAASAAGVGGLRWLATRREDDGIPWPLRRAHEINEQLARDYFRGTRLSPSFPRELAREPRVNGSIGLEDDLDAASWRLNVSGLADADEQDTDLQLTLDQIKALPRVEMVTELRCIEGWSAVVQWAGARFADFINAYRPATRSGRPSDPQREPEDLVGYVSLETEDGSYYVGLDMESALHSQTLLCYEMNGKPLTEPHGAPLRLAIPVKYGIKNIKRIGTIRFTDRRPPDYWAERGYDWYAGH